MKLVLNEIPVAFCASIAFRRVQAFFPHHVEMVTEIIRIIKLQSNLFTAAPLGLLDNVFWRATIQLNISNELGCH